jgi:hypothetical protein
MSLPDLRIQQAIALVDIRGVCVAGSSPEVDTAEVERIAILFGSRPPGVACPLAHFACPFGARQVAVVRVEDRPGSGDVLGFRFLILSRELYRHLGDPFAISERYPATWDSYPELAWPPRSLPARTLAQLDAVLKSGDGPLLLGATQALVDGNRVVLVRAAPDEPLVRGLWMLLPDRTRRDLWPATFAFSNELGFHLAMMPAIPDSHGDQPLTEEALRDYPPSSYELNLQIAVESGDEAGLRSLLARRTADETIRLALYMIAFALLVALLFRFIP